MTEETRPGALAANQDFLAQVGPALVVVRSIRGLSQADLARAADIRPNQVSRYETGQVLPQLPQLVKLLDGLGVEIADFVVVCQVLSWLDRRLDAAEGTTFSPSTVVGRVLDEEIALLEAARNLVTWPLPAEEGDKEQQAG